MKSHRKQLTSKRSSREESKKSTQPTNVKKISCSILLKMPTTIASKSLMLNSYRAGRNSKPEVSKNQPMTSHHSRKLSIQQPTSSRKQSAVLIKSKDKISQGGNNKKQHARSNSTLSKKSFKQTKNCFKIDLSKLTNNASNKSQRQNKVIIEPRANKHEDIEKIQVGKGHFEFEYVIGKGGFGKVWSVQMKKNSQKYAMKEMNKAKIIAKRSIHSVLNQRMLLSQLKHPFIVNMSHAFQDREKLYLVMDLLSGGDLRYHMGCRRRFKEGEAKFFIACIILGLQYLHLNNIIHRDIKPENLVFDEKGYLRVTDLGIARIMKPNNSSDTSGTPGYMAPQVMCRQDHSLPVDYYAMGVIAYELMLGKRPYNGKNRREIRENIISKQIQVKAEQIPPGWSVDAANFINKLIQRKTNNRLGTEGGIIEIKQHPWFRGFAWGQLLKKSIPAPFVPNNILGSDDYLDQISDSSEDENQQQNLLLLRKQGVDQAFEDYSYFARQSTKLNYSLKEQKKLTKKSATTANTYGSYMQEKQHRQKETSSRTNKGKNHNFFKM